MTITINGPDGSTFNFPDGTTDDIIGRAVRNHYGTTQAAAPAAPATPAAPPIAPGDPRFTPMALEAKQAIRGFLPGIGPLVSDRGSAALSALAQPLSGAGTTAPTFRQRYAQNLAQETSAREAYEAAHPLRSAAIQGASGTVGLLAGGGLIPGAATALGMTGRLATAIPRAAASGAVLGAADIAARGGDPTQGAIGGALTGAAGPLIGKGAGMVWDAARGAMRPISDVPERFLPQPVAGVNVPVRESVLTRDLPTAREEQIMLKGEGVPTAVQAEQATTDAMRQAHANLATQMDPTGQAAATQAAGVHPLGSAVDDLVAQEQQRASAEVARLVGARQDTAQLRTDVGGGVQGPMSVADVGTSTGQRIRDLFAGARAATRAAYGAAASVPATYNPRYLINAGATIRDALNNLPGDARVRISPGVTPQASAALDTIDQEIAQLRFTNDAARGNRPITPADMEQVRKQLVIQRRRAGEAARMPGGNWEDVRAVGRVMDAFDAWEQATATRPGGLLTGNPADVIATRQAARAAHADERATFSRRGPGDQVGNFMENVVGKYPGQEMSPEKIMRTLMGTPDNPAANENAVPILNHLRDNVFGANSPEWNSIKRGLISHLTEAPPGAEPIPPIKQAQRMDTFLGNQRHAGAILDAGEQARLQQHADNLRGVQDVPPQPGTIEAKIAQLSSPSTTGDQLLSALTGQQGGNIATELRQRLTPENLGALKASMFSRISQAPEGMLPWEHQKTGQNIAKFLSTDLARNLYSSSELGIMRDIANAHLQIVPIPGSTNVSGSGYTGAAIAKQGIKMMTRNLLRMIGLAHGHLPGLLAGEALASARERIGEQLAARRSAQRAEQLFLGRRPLAPVRAPQAVGAFAAPLLTQQENR